MQKYLLRRALFALGTLIGVSLIIFVVLRVLPGDPLVAILGVDGHAKRAPADRAAIMQDLGLSDSLPVQYARWMRDIATGQLGKSFFRGDTVTDLLVSVMSREPDWTLLPEATPPRLIDLLRRCLKKDVRDRLRDTRRKDTHR